MIFQVFPKFQIRFSKLYFQFQSLNSKKSSFSKVISHFSKSIFTKSLYFFRNRFSLSQKQYLNHDSRFSKSLFSKYFPIFEANIMFSNMHFQKFIAHAWFFVHLGIRIWFRQVEQSKAVDWSLVQLPLVKAPGTVEPRTDRRVPFFRIFPHFKTEASYFQNLFQRSVWLAKSKNFAMITGLATEMGPVFVWSI